MFFVYLRTQPLIKIPVVSPAVGLEIEKYDPDFAYGEDNLAGEVMKSLSDFQDFFMRKEKELMKKVEGPLFNNYPLYQVEVCYQKDHSLYNVFFIRSEHLILKNQSFLEDNIYLRPIFVHCHRNKKMSLLEMDNTFYIKSAVRIAEPGEYHPREN